MKDDLISRQDAISALCDKFKRTPTNAIRAMDAIKQLPPAQPERKKGKWIKEDSIYGTVTCSVCYGVRRDNRINHINFCNCCGADMRGGQE